jgi:ribosomal protein S18 acetylase RimI-like enzyme
MAEKLPVILREGTLDDAKALKELYKDVAKKPGGIVRTAGEIDEKLIGHVLATSLERGLMIVAQDAKDKTKLRGSIHAYTPKPVAFSHLYSSLTIVVHPNFQGKGVGRLIFTKFLDTIKTSRKEIFRVELMVRESNLKGILLYETLGFIREGRMENRIRSAAGGYEADIAMAWFNRNFRAKND